MSIRKIAAPYIAQYKRSPRWAKTLSFLIILYIATPIDIWDIVFPFAAYADDIFLAGVLLKLLHKYGSLPEEELSTPRDLVDQIKTMVFLSKDQSEG